MTITSGRYTGDTRTIDAAVFQLTVDWPEEFAPGYHVVLNGEEVVKMRWDKGDPAWQQSYNGTGLVGCLGT